MKHSKKIKNLFFTTLMITGLSGCEESIIEIKNLVDRKIASEETVLIPQNLSLSSLRINTSNATPTLSFDFDALVDGTSYCLGDTVNDCNISASTQTPSTSFALSGLSLVDGDYFFNLKNVLGTSESAVASIGFSVDTTGPTITNPTLVLGSPDSVFGATMYWDSLTASPTVTYAVNDADLDVVQYCIGLSETGCEVEGFTDVSTTSFSVSPITTSEGVNYYMNLRATDDLGNTSAISSMTWTTDTSDPTAPAVASTSSYSSSLTQLPEITFTLPTDSTLGTNPVRYQIGTTAGAQDVIAPTIVTTSSIQVSGLSLTQGEEYFITVSIIDRAGNTSSTSSISFVADITTPNAPTSVGISGVLTNNTTTTPTLSYTDSDSSELFKHQYCIERNGGTSCDVVAFTDTPSNSFNVSGLTLTEGEYRLVLKSIDVSGSESSTVATTWNIDTTNPTSITSLVAPDTTQITSTGAVTFTGIGDSDLDRYEYSIGTSSGGTQIVGWTDLGTSTGFTRASLSLAFATTYYVNVRSIDDAGNFTVVTDSFSATSPAPLDTIFRFNNISPSPAGDLVLARGIRDSNSKIVVVGTKYATSSEQGFIARLNADLSLDTSFNSTGFNILPDLGGNRTEKVMDIKEDSSGNYWAVGLRENGSGNFLVTVWKLTSAGVLDTSFGTAGVYQHTSWGTSDTQFWSIATTSTGPLIVGGTYSTSNFLKLTTTGSLDTSFNGTGTQAVDTFFGRTANVTVTRALVDASGSIFISGGQRQSGRGPFIGKLTPSLAADTSFSGDGYHNLNSSPDLLPRSLTMDPSGNLYVAGAANLDSICYWKVNSSGVQDTSFIGSGFSCYVPLGSASDLESYSIAHDGTNLIDVGYIIGGGTDGRDVIITKRDSNGALDTSFDSNGFLITDDYAEITPDDNEERLYEILSVSATQSVVLGITVGGDGNFAFVKLFNH